MICHPRKNILNQNTVIKFSVQLCEMCKIICVILCKLCETILEKPVILKILTKLPFQNYLMESTLLK